MAIKAYRRPITIPSNTMAFYCIAIFYRWMGRDYAKWRRELVIRECSERGKRKALLVHGLQHPLSTVLHGQQIGHGCWSTVLNSNGKYAVQTPSIDPLPHHIDIDKTLAKG